jgi:hypothetical protein
VNGTRQLLGVMLVAAIGCTRAEPSSAPRPEPHEPQAPPALQLVEGSEYPVTNGLFGLDGDEFHTNPWKNGAVLYDRHVLDGDYGLFIDAPTRVQPERHTSIPVPLFYAAEQREAFKIDIVSQAKVVAVRLEDRRVFVANALEQPDNSAPRPRIGKDSSDPTSERQVLDLQAQLRLLDRPGTYRIVVLLTQQTSNVVEVVVEGRSFAHEDPEVAKFLEAKRTPRQPAPPDPPTIGLLPAVDRAPPVPDAPGLNLAIERVVLLEHGATAILRGSYALEVRPRDDSVPASGDYGTPRPSAILPIELVVVAERSTAHTVIPLRIPIYEALGQQPKLVTGSFAIDLLRHPDLQIDARTYSIYAFCGEVMTGPMILATVTEQMLPRPGE